MTKAENFILFGLFDNVQILLACGINTFNGITNGISYFNDSIWTVARDTLLEHPLFIRILRSIFFMFPLLLLTVEAQNANCNSLITILPQVGKI